MSAYFNYSTFWPANWWERGSFLRAWWQLYRGDRHLTPPDYPALARLVRNVSAPFATQSTAQAIYMEALPQRNSRNSATFTGPVGPGAYFEDPVAAAIVQVDPRREDGAAYLSLLRCVNDEETLDRLLGQALEHASELGCMQLIGPTGPTPTWQSGALEGHFNLFAPWQTPYNPPYLPDLLQTSMEPFHATTLYTLAVPAALPAALQTAVITPLAPARLSADLLPLLGQSLASDGAFPPPDAAEATALLAWLASFPLVGWLALVDGEPVGFVLLQADYGPLMRRTGGGRSLPWRAYLRLRRHAPMPAGRLLFGAVDDSWQRQGIGLQLWRQTLLSAQQARWRTLTCGPFVSDGPGAAFMQRQGAQPQQRYVVYTWGG